MNDTFEEIVKSVNWSSTTDCAAEKMKLMSKYSLTDIDAIRHHMDRMWISLDAAIDAYEDEHGSMGITSDDGHSDLLYHIISKGEAYVNEVLANPILAKERWDSGDYYESFSYIFPYESDFELLDIYHYVQASEQILAALKDYSVLEDPIDSEDIRELCAEFRQGKFNPELSYDELYALGQKIGLGAYIANVWNDGRRYFYQMT